MVKHNTVTFEFKGKLDETFVSESLSVSVSVEIVVVWNIFRGNL